jgi:hypothetical protein
MKENPLVSASLFVQRGLLTAVGCYPTERGHVPFVVAVPVEAEDGYLDIGSEIGPEIGEALDELSRKVKAGMASERDKKFVEDLVARGRENDQNALAEIEECGQAAKKGSQRARYMFGLIVRFMEDNPIGRRRKWAFWRQKPQISGEPEAPVITTQKYLAKALATPQITAAAIVSWAIRMPVDAAIVLLANGYWLDASAIRSVAQALPTKEDRILFARGMQGKQDGSKLGRIVGTARKIQIVRRGGPIAMLSRAAAQELGEIR